LHLFIFFTFFFFLISPQDYLKWRW